MRTLALTLLLVSAPALAQVRVVAVGDTGKGGLDAQRVAAAVKRACAARGGCDVGLLLGDNVYERGVRHASSPLLDERIHDLYGDAAFPVYLIPGNHDYGAPDAFFYLGFLGLDQHRAAAQMKYAQEKGSSLKMPGWEYRVRVRDLELVGFDTLPVYWMDWPPVAGFLGLKKRAERMGYTLDKWSFESDARWRIAFGHHPYQSAGHHGPAGKYEGLPPGFVGSGAYLKRWLERHVLGRFDVYIAGHTHSLSDHGDVEGTAVLVSGAGSKLSPLEHEEDAAWSASTFGFVILETRRDALKIDFLDVEGAVLHSRELRR